MKFKKELMQRIVDNDIDLDEAEVIKDEIIETSRWSVINYLIFKVGSKFYESSYSYGATEQQDESPYEYDGDEIECSEVFPIEKTIVVYVKDTHPDYKGE